jgi:hypothetical protein
MAVTPVAMVMVSVMVMIAVAVAVTITVTIAVVVTIFDHSRARRSGPLECTSADRRRRSSGYSNTTETQRGDGHKNGDTHYGSPFLSIVAASRILPRHDHQRMNKSKLWMLQPLRFCPASCGMAATA